MAVRILVEFGIQGFVPEIIVALAIAFGYPAALRYLDRAPPAWQR